MVGITNGEIVQLLVLVRFTKGDLDSSWIAELHRAPTPPPRITSPSVLSTQPTPLAVASPPAVASPLPTFSSFPDSNKDSSFHQISALKAENASLLTEVERLRGSESSEYRFSMSPFCQCVNTQFLELYDSEASLKEQRTQLNQQVNSLRSECVSLSAEMERLRASESSKCCFFIFLTSLKPFCSSIPPD